MQHNWYGTSWCHKIVALVIITSYFILLIFVHDSTYIWATLALIVVLFVTTFSCATTSSPFILQLRGTRVTGITDRAIASQRQNDEGDEDTRIWMTDIPPSYSFVMSHIPPQTPPPSYGSAIILFPPPYVAVDTKVEQEESLELPQRRPLSISTQVSMSSNMQDAVQMGGISFSTQVSMIGSPAESPVAVRARFYISRQESREEEPEPSGELMTDQLIGEATGKLFQFSREGIGENKKAVSREEGAEGKLKHDLRRRLLLSRQASREENVNEVQNLQEKTETNVAKAENKDGDEVEVKPHKFVTSQYSSDGSQISRNNLEQTREN